MRLFKLLVSVLILGFIALFVWQNIATFSQLINFSLDLYVREPVEWSHHLYTLLLFSALVGLLVGIGLMLKPYFNTRRLLAQERQVKQQAPPAEPEASSPVPVKEEEKSS